MRIRTLITDSVAACRARAPWVLGLGLLPLAVQGIAGTVAVTTGTQYQVIQGFGASSYAESAYSTAMADTFWTDESNLALGSGTNGVVGLSILRLDIDEGGNFAAQGGVAQQAKGINPNMEIFASEWSPPAADKNNNSVDGPGSTAANTNTNFNPPTGSGTNTIITADLPAYATFQTGFLTTMKNTYGIDIYAVSPQNEPDWNTTYDSCLWSPAQFDTYVQDLAADIKAAGLSTKIMMPESFADNLAGSATTMTDPNAAPDVSIIGMHLYGGGPTAVPASYSTEAGAPGPELVHRDLGKDQRQRHCHRERRLLRPAPAQLHRGQQLQRLLLLVAGQPQRR